MAGEHMDSVDERISNDVPVSFEEFMEWARATAEDEHEIIHVVHSNHHDEGEYPVALFEHKLYQLIRDPLDRLETHCSCGKRLPNTSDLDHHLRDVHDGWGTSEE